MYRFGARMRERCRFFAGGPSKGSLTSYFCAALLKYVYSKCRNISKHASKIRRLLFKYAESRNWCPGRTILLMKTCSHATRTILSCIGRKKIKIIFILRLYPILWRYFLEIVSSSYIISKIVCIFYSRFLWHLYAAFQVNLYGTYHL